MYFQIVYIGNIRNPSIITGRTRLMLLTQLLYRRVLKLLTRIGSDGRSVGWVSSFNKDRVKLLTLIIISCKLHIRHLYHRLSLVLVRGNTALLIMT